MAFCIRGAESRLIEKVSVIEVEIKAIRIGIDYCLQHGLVPLIIETDLAQKVLNGIWEVPWLITLDVSYIKSLLMNREVEVVHTYREGNTLADFFTNYAFDFAGTQTPIL